MTKKINPINLIIGEIGKAVYFSIWILIKKIFKFLLFIVILISIGLIITWIYSNCTLPCSGQWIC